MRIFIYSCQSSFSISPSCSSFTLSLPVSVSLFFSNRFLTSVPAGKVPRIPCPNPSPWSCTGWLCLHRGHSSSGGGGGHPSRRNLRHSVPRRGVRWRGSARSCRCFVHVWRGVFQSRLAAASLTACLHLRSSCASQRAKNSKRVCSDKLCFLLANLTRFLKAWKKFFFLIFIYFFSM